MAVGGPWLGLTATVPSGAGSASAGAPSRSTPAAASMAAAPTRRALPRTVPILPHDRASRRPARNGGPHHLCLREYPFQVGGLFGDSLRIVDHDACLFFDGREPARVGAVDRGAGRQQ